MKHFQTEVFLCKIQNKVLSAFNEIVIKLTKYKRKECSALSTVLCFKLYFTAYSEDTDHFLNSQNQNFIVTKAKSIIQSTARSTPF